MSLFVATIAALIIVLPVALQDIDDRRMSGPETHPSFDGEVHVLSGEASVAALADVSARIDAAIALLRDGSRGAQPERRNELNPGPASAGAPSIDAVDLRLEDRLATHGLTGSWRTASLLDLEQLRPPYLVPVETRTGPSVVVVRRLHAGFVFGFEPTRGHVLYPSEAFERAWSGRVRTLTPPVEIDAFWE